MLGYVPAPELITGHHIVQVLFEIGPAKAEAALSEADLEPWERRRGIELEPWEAQAVVTLSGAYMQEAHQAREPNALPPWPRAINMWRFVRDTLDAPKLRENLQQPIKEARRGKQRQGAGRLS